jgi:hypothetical protein
MAEQYFQVEVMNTPEIVEKYVVARFDENTNQLWFYGSWNDEIKAKDVAIEIDGIVVRRIDNGAV